MSITKESLNSLKQRIDLREVIGKYIHLKPAGSQTHKGLCPFHNEKTPSFTVQAEHYHCYGCGAHGDAIGFLQKHTHTTFTEAAQLLADSYGIPLEYVSQPEYSNKKRIIEALGEVTTTFQGVLLHTEDGHTALQYLYSRGIDLEMINRFRLGFVPDEATMDTLWKEKGNGLDSYKSGIHRKFSGRISIPICDSMGRVVAFSCRRWKEVQEGVKYVNSPGTEVFQKGSLLFGLDHSRARIAKEGNVILVEGYTDAMRLIQEGMDFTVATMGTAVTENHCLELRNRGAKRVYVVFDGDDAGREASIKSAALMMGTGIESVLVYLPEGEDVDSYVLQYGILSFTQLLERGSEFLQAAIKHKISIHGDTPIGKSRAAKEVLAMVNNWKDPVLVLESKKQLSVILEVDESSLAAISGVDKGCSRFITRNAVQAELEALSTILDSEKGDNDLVLMLHTLEEADFTNDDARQAFSLLRCTDKNADRVSILERAGLSALVKRLKATASTRSAVDLVRILRRDSRLHRMKMLQKLLETTIRQEGNSSPIIAQIRTIEAELAMFV